ncbi:tetraacyldisaccharide 4'-kinase [Flavobacterium sp.]|uniref:tetraacyldisaccharide 4'-kinase n=1 Tax=Flavobacterium sp. TaxID=239 RepID=UPI00286A95CC|nr:tetraacyldisaccharide 4'-kinase [Flavobacterium sp.]
MILLRILLFPFAIIYWLVTSIRNYLYDLGILKSYSFNVPIIAVGNLSVGGTGKTPMIEYLIRLLSEQYAVATLSRGYKRQSTGFILADDNANAQTLGDEPFQIHQKFANIQVAVDANRKNGIEQLLSQNKKPQIILLDDAFQHRKVKAGFYILLTAYGDLFTDDWMLPTGNLRESRSGTKRADLIIVTKCPTNISETEQKEIRGKLERFLLRRNDSDSMVFFTSIAYDDSVYSADSVKKVSEIKTTSKLLLAGIAKPKPFFAYLQHVNDVVLTFPDHHDFSDSDIQIIKKQAENKLIITTEKDYVRLKNHIPASQLFYLPIKTKFVLEGNNFDQTILNYVGTSTANR